MIGESRLPGLRLNEALPGSLAPEESARLETTGFDGENDDLTFRYGFEHSGVFGILGARP